VWGNHVLDRHNDREQQSTAYLMHSKNNQLSSGGCALQIVVREPAKVLMCRWNNLGYVASFITFCGATIFWISTITGVPGVLPNESTHIAEWHPILAASGERLSKIGSPTLAACF